MVNLRLAKLWAPKIAAMIGVRMSATRALTTAVNAVPTTTATARSMTLPRKRKRLKSVSSFGTGWRLDSLQGSAVPFRSWADRQAGRVAWWQLMGLGIDDTMVVWWIADGYLHRVHPRVYAVGHR